MKKQILHLLTLIALTSATAYGQTVTGKVTSFEDGTALPGVTVLMKGTTIGTATDADGNYTVNAPGVQSATLVFSFVGYATAEVAVSGRSVVNIQLAPDLKQLEEIVVTALGIERNQKALGYAVSRLSSQDITASGNTNFASALYGKAAGVRVTSAPGGATSAVNVQIRGINSINAGNNQPLYVVDGIMIRNIEGTGLNNGGYWDDQKIRGNGILDINPSEIESLTVLKGASAAALYGSEASNGVIVITTKKGEAGRGLGVDFNYIYTRENVAFTPPYQNTYGPGYDRETNMGSFGSNEEGFIPVDLDGDGTFESERPIFRAWGQFGPRMDGRQVVWWDGSIRNYSPQPDNYKDFYETGHSSNFNVALTNSTQSASYRFSYNRLDYKSIAPGANSNRNTFSLNSSIKLADRVNVDLIGSYISSFVHNRPEAINRLMANYGGFFGRSDDMDVYWDKYQTSQGYKYVPIEQSARNPDEAIKYSIRAYDLLEYLWRNVRDIDEENQDRILSSVTLNYEILKNLNFRGRVGNDFTSFRGEIKRHNEYPIAFNGTNSTGSYTALQNRFSILYTDALLSYGQDLSDAFNFKITAGFQSRSQNFLRQSSGTRDGLIEENWFSMNNSFNGNLNTSAINIRTLMYAYLGILDFSFKDYLFLQGTGRQEYHSTLPPDKNSYFYPSANLGFVFTEAFNMPSGLLSYGKLRASYAGVSNPPRPYEAVIAYAQEVLSTSNGSVPQLSADRDYGNEEIRPERKYETEVGLETRFFRNNLGIDVVYYSNKVKDQILNLALPRSMGALSRLANVGELQTNGIEVGLNAAPFNRGGIRWDTRLSFAQQQTKVNKLAEGMDELIGFNGDAGAFMIKAEEGEPIGNIYVHPRTTDNNGNYIIDEYGLYVLSSDYVKAGNIQPKAVGGWGNTVTYKGLSLDFLIDYRFGGQLVSPPALYATGAGMYESTMKYRDEANGGLPYNMDGDGNKTLAASHAEAQYHDGVLLEGVTTTGEPNTTIVDAANYYINSFYWASGWYEEGAVFDNNYVKMREIVLTYRLPSSVSERLRFQNLSISLIGRNLFYLHRTLKYLDPEVAIGTNWVRQGLDEGSLAATRSFGLSLNARF